MLGYDFTNLFPTDFSLQVSGNEVAILRQWKLGFRNGFNLSLSFHLGLLIRFTDGSFVDIGGRVLHTLLYGGAGGLAVKKWV